MREALKLATERELVPVLLGDLFDSRNDRDDTLEVLNLVFNYKQELLLCQSNHQWALLRYLQGKRDSNPLLERTMLQLYPYSKLVERWLSALPYGFILQSSNGREYRVAHAQHPSGVTNKVTLPGMANSKLRGLFLYGAHGANRERVPWWENPKGRNWVRVAGHYHKVFASDEALVLDGCCGEPGGTLVAYDTRLQRMEQFDA